MLRSLHLHHFKGFERFALRLRDDAFFAGPNNAGKSTLIAALRAVAYMRRIAVRRRADTRRRDGEAPLPAYGFRPEEVRLVAENLKYEFRENEQTRLEARFSNGTALFAVWPPGTADDTDPFFYVRERGGGLVDRPTAAQRALPDIGVVPVLSPIDQEENVLTDKHVRANVDSRLASRHCRNQLRLLDAESVGGSESQLDRFIAFIRPWLPELALEGVRQSYAAGGAFLDVFYTEPGSPREKELFWAGDGIQIWLQLLLHIFRLQNVDVLILDEPEVFLHADLQRRLVRLLQEVPAQAITATHSPELMAAASPQAVIWVARNRDRAVVVPDQSTLAELSRAVGTQFNLKLARALRTQVALFVEGQDMEIIRGVARALGYRNVATETGIAVIPLEGFSNWEHVEPFAWLTRDLLEDAVTTFVVLDRDYRSDEASSSVKDRLGTLNIKAHVWRRKELESYLLDPPTIARLSGAEEGLVRAALHDAAAALEHKVAARMLVERQQERVTDRMHRVSVAEEFNEEFDELWGDEDRRLEICPPDDLFAGVNRRLQAEGFRAVSPRQVAHAIPAEGVPDEMSGVIGEVDRAVD